MKTNKERIDYLNRLKNDIQKFQDASLNLLDTILCDIIFNTDSEKMINKEYPFDESFNNINSLIKIWTDKTIETINTELSDCNEEDTCSLCTNKEECEFCAVSILKK
jgi:hypothetical protein